MKRSRTKLDDIHENEAPDIGDNTSKRKRNDSFSPREILSNDKHSIVGCIIAVDTGRIGSEHGKLRLGIIKFYFPKWGKYFIHLFSSEEGTTEFATLPKAVKEINSWIIKGSIANVDMSRVDIDRLWVGESDWGNITLVTDQTLWERVEHDDAIRDDPPTDKEWRQCNECEYLIDVGEPFTQCKECHVPYHSDCLFHFEKHPGRGYDTLELDADARIYRAAARKWNSRKGSKKSTMRLDDSELSDSEATQVVPKEKERVDEFVCKSCRECRFCCEKLRLAIIPSSTNQAIEPTVICTKCNTGAHGHCVFPAVPKLHSSVQWVCDECRECNSCGRVTYLNESTGLPSLLTDWALPSFDQCRTCFAGLDKGEYCPVCMKAWSVEWGGDMVQCDACEFWVHVSCDDLGSVNLSKLEKDGVKYTCPICRDTTDVHRRRRVIDLLRAIDKVALFSEPVSAGFMPVYLKVIKNPMDLAKMRKKHYSTNLEFIKDFELIVENAKVFNMPNSPAYRLAEQFHKQGKLLIEKYLLTERKGASKIEGLTVEVEEVADQGGQALEASPASEQQSITQVSKRAASIMAEKMWRKEASSTHPTGRRKLTYDQALEMIKRMTPQAVEAQEAAPQASGTISPYKRRLSHPKGTLMSPRMLSPLDAGSTTKPSSGMVTPAATGPSMSDEEIERTVAKLFGFSSLVFLKNKMQLFSDQDSSESFSRISISITLKSNLLSLVGKKPKAEEVAAEARWTLFDLCSVCGSFGEPWNFVECGDCGECAHWSCCGLVGNPNETVVPKHSNPLLRPTDQKKSFKYQCSSCSNCRYCQSHASTGNVVACCLCGSRAHRECRSQFFTSHELNPNMFRLNFSTETGYVATPATGLPVCEDCVISQALRFFKAETCKHCDSLINPNVASCYFRSMPDGSASPTAVSGRLSPSVHCVACGDVWHARCIPEFSDVSNSDILGVYVCPPCIEGIAPVVQSQKAISDERALVDESLNSMSQVLKEYRPNSYKEVQIDFAIDVLRNAGMVCPDRNSCLLADLIDIFQGPSANEYIAEILKLTESEKAWIEWGMLHKDFLVGLGNPVLEMSKKKASTGALLDSANSVRVKRIEDEDLVLVKRLYSAFHFIQALVESPSTVKDDLMEIDLGNKENAMIDSLSNSNVCLGTFPNKLSSIQAPREFLLTGSELGARLIQVWWLRAQQSGGYLGPRTPYRKGRGIVCIEDQGIPDWEDRRCKMCGIVGDRLALGCLLPCSDSTWVHSECVAWTIPESSWLDSVGVSHARPQRDPMGPSEYIEPPPRLPRKIPTEWVTELIESNTRTVCAVCDKGGATVFCQSCHSASAFHLPCAISVNAIAVSSSSDPRVLMDSRCRLLTCGKCLYRHPDTERYFTQQFGATVSSMRASQSALNQVWSIRHQCGLTLDPSNHQLEAAHHLDHGHVVREGTLSIVNPGSFDDSYVYDGSGPIIPSGYVALRLFWQVDLVLSPEDEEGGVRITNNVRELPKLRKRRRGAYLCKISHDASVFTIQFVAGRVVAVGTSISEVWNEFKSFVFGDTYNAPAFMTGEWFFGLKSNYMQRFLSDVAMSSVKRQAGINREKWLYQPQSREYVTCALGLKQDLKAVSSVRRNLSSRIEEYKANIDQLKNLGREVSQDISPRERGDILEPALVICEYSGNGEEASVTAAKPSRSKMTSASTDVPVTGDTSMRYKVRSSIPDERILAVKRSKIHNYGLFARNGFTKGDLVVEYQGEILRQTIADEREKKSERQGDGDGGSCYMFKLDDDYVVDATVKGNCSRFINHSCNPNCSCKMIEDETRQKHIMIIAKRDILPGEEITYDYQFAVESEKLACLCGAPNCLGRLN